MFLFEEKIKLKVKYYLRGNGRMNFKRYMN